MLYTLSSFQKVLWLFYTHSFFVESLVFHVLNFPISMHMVSFVSRLYSNLGYKQLHDFL